MYQNVLNAINHINHTKLFSFFSQYSLFIRNNNNSLNSQIRVVVTLAFLQNRFESGVRNGRDGLSIPSIALNFRDKHGSNLYSR